MASCSAEAKRASFVIEHVPGEELESIVHGLYRIEPAFAARMKQILGAVGRDAVTSFNVQDSAGAGARPGCSRNWFLCVRVDYLPDSE